jgi:hypothetical protein
MKKVRTPQEVQAGAAARSRALFVAVVAFVAGVVVLAISGPFLALHCVLAIAVALSGGIAAARAAIPIDPASFRRAGAIGGIYVTFAYALPFMAYYLYSFLTVNEASVARRMAELSPVQLGQIREFNIELGAEYFRGQDISYVFGYLLFALVLGWLVGSLGGILARRQLMEG